MIEPVVVEVVVGEGNVRIVRSPWNEAFLNELCEFPTGTFDDQVDAASGAVNKVLKGRRAESF